MTREVTMGRFTRLMATAGLLFGALAGAALAQTVGLGTTQGGATGQIATALAQVVSQHGGGLQVRPQAVANTAQYIPAINQGQLEFGIANLPQTSYAITGTGMGETQANPNLRMVATLFPFNAGLVVTKQSGMRSYADLKGKRVPWYPDKSLGDYIMRASLEVAGLKPEDVVRVPMANFPRQFEAFKAGQIDASIAAVGSQPTIEFEASLPGGIRFLTFKKDDEATLARWMPGTYLRNVPVRTETPGVEADTLVFAYDYTLFANASVPDDVVYRFAKAIHDRPTDLKATSPLWEEYDPKQLAKDVKLTYHPGALRFYREAGIWKGQ
jgi:TRAP transporter TAXI family solute receptor